MTIITDDRTELNAAYADHRVTLLVLSGSEATAARAIHDEAVATIKEKWRRTFWITDLSILSDSEIGDPSERLFARGGRYAIVGRCRNADGTTKRFICKRGYHDDLLYSDGSAASDYIREAFAEGDLKRTC